MPNELEIKKVGRGRPALVNRPIEKTISLPETLVLQVDLELFSPLEGRVPHGAWSRFVTSLINNHLSKVPKNVATSK